MNNPTLIHGDCLEKLYWVIDGSVDLVLTDPPYGTTACKWDTVIPFEPMWSEIWRVLKPNGACALFGSEPFSSHLRMSQIKYFKYDWIWDKVNKFSGHLNAKKQPLRITEVITIFYRKQCAYNPIMVPGKPYTTISSGAKTKNYGKQIDKVKTINTGLYYPKNLLAIPGDERVSVGRIHPTQKPVALLEYIIKTYTLEGETVLDFTMGSGSTGVACVNTGRKFIGIEEDDKYFEIAKQRIDEALKAKTEYKD
ncbi:MAG: site-specific DNA-methyltransferase [Candidatus Pacearchaeota archaeon]|nr:site-specific DNA-methyltransferase [Candidatus Pacearchaeota archaeon]